MKLIVGKIAAIVTDNTVVVNRGSSDGVTQGMEFTVQLDVPKIKDPTILSVRLVECFMRKPV